MMAVLGAVCGFFAGLALGAFALDGAIRRARSPRVVYAVLEAVIGLWGLAISGCSPLRPRLDAAARHGAPTGVALAASFALPVFVLLPATVAMGGTLAALERMIRELPARPVSAPASTARTPAAQWPER